MIKQLKDINFGDLLILDTNINEYDFNSYLNSGNHPIKGFCTKCEQKGINICPTDQKFKLQAISHGSMSDDYIMALEDSNIDTSSWKTENVLFIMESPGIVNDFYKEVEYNGIKKCPSVEWYWIHEKQEKYTYPDNFIGGAYGNLFNSIIFTFELKNAYFTNFVKCGLNDENGNYKGLDEYDQNCITTCFNEYLLKEIDIIKPKIVFCFGSKAESLLWDYYPNEYSFSVVGLPHPARSRQGFKNEFFRHLYFHMILEALYKSGIYTFDETMEKYKLFLQN